MKKIVTLVITLLLVITLASCTNEEVDITIIIYSDNPTKTIQDLEDLPELLAIEISSLGIEFNRVVVQSSNDASLIEASLLNGDATIAIMDPFMVQSSSIERVLDIVMDEIDHPDGDMDHKTYQKAIVVSNTMNGDTFVTGYETNPVHTLLNGLNVCSTVMDEDLIEDFAISLGATAIEDVTITHATYSTSELYEKLQDGSCDLGVVTLEEVYMYESIWEDNDENLYNDLQVVHTFDPIYYEGLYAATGGDEILINSVIQAFIQISSNNVNSDMMDLLGHSSYYIPE